MKAARSRGREAAQGGSARCVAKARVKAWALSDVWLAISMLCPGGGVWHLQRWGTERSSTAEASARVGAAHECGDGDGGEDEDRDCYCSPWVGVVRVRVECSSDRIKVKRQVGAMREIPRTHGR